MNLVAITLALFLASFSAAIAGQPSSISFDGKQYVFRTSENSSHSFTPVEQANLSSRKDMISFVFADYVKTKSDLKSLAENLLSTYNTKGKLLKAVAGPNTSNPDWFLLVAVMTGNNISEAIMARVSIENSIGVVMVYTHRFYGDDQGKDVVIWFEKNGYKQESNLISFVDFPRMEELQ